ncbi:TPM domain-containing protein [Rhodothermus profundi]|uniref:TPM domain-containing protein n=1 Tax=Rhodothermus profundi TaxID=633813 RepID=A0A1M6WPY5_9BACT|nr:TPM domain-containing protein [Rhodothermus profundi]SHK95674.1 uncharacterized protein SAMN04488087_2381 [Rhodothermus profundi]
MQRANGWLGWLLGLLLGWGAFAQQIEVISPTGQWVTDLADLLTPAEEQMLSRKLATYADTTSTQIVIVTLPTLNGVPAADYAVALGRRWGVGQAEYDNGVVILVAREEREVFIATGYGLEGAIPDALAGRIVRDIIIPRFRQGDFYGGLSAAVDAIIAAAQGEFQPPERSGNERSLWDIGVTLFVLLVLLLFIMSASRGMEGPPRGRKRHRHPYRVYQRTSDFPPIIIWGGSMGSGGGWSSGGGWGGGDWGGFSGGGGSFGGGGAGGHW